MNRLTRLACGASVIVWLSAQPIAATAQSVDFNNEIRPILSSKCFQCHGPDEETREADLRLDTFEGAHQDLGGYRALEPGDSDASEIMLRITSDDPDMVMPPPDSNDALTQEEIASLKQWIDQGGAYAQHWTFIPPVRTTESSLHHGAIASQPDLPRPKDSVDAWIQTRLKSVGLSPNPTADRWTLVRRLYLDIVGLPPTPEEAKAFVNDNSPMAYAKQVDRLLADPAQAERQARIWLDLAHYADTNGYEKDRPRSIWPYRDWVIEAFARDMPFDQFTLEQIAGDMLPNATVSQKIATGFLRNTMLNEEGGIDPLEYRFHAMVDRVNTIGTTWLGMTIECAQCHTHKYDPITHRDYYALMSLINNADEPDVIVSDEDARESLNRYEVELRQLVNSAIEAWPNLASKSNEESESDSGNSEASVSNNFEEALGRWVLDQAERLVDWQVPAPSQLESTLPKLRLQEDGSIFADGDAAKREEYKITYAAGTRSVTSTAMRLEVLPDDRLPARGPGRSYYEGRRGDFFLSEIRVFADGNPVRLRDASHSHGSLSIGSGGAAAGNVLDGNASTGWSTSNRPGQPHRLVVNFAEPVSKGAELRVEFLFERHFAASLGRFRIAFAESAASIKTAPLSASIQQSLRAANSIDAVLTDGVLRQQLQQAFVLDSDLFAEQQKAIAQKLNQRPRPTTSLALRERADDNLRRTFIHHRGEYLKPGDEVTGAVPEVFAPLLSEHFGPGGPSNRLELAQWLSSQDNPLVARVTANRQWRTLFGQGIVRTSGDFGTQSEPPAYPEVLDDLAVGWMEESWSLKRLIRRIVFTNTYRQSSYTDAHKQSTDPDNRLLSRGPRFRLDAEIIRDSALRSSGKLTHRIGGPSVYPPQPPSVTELAYGSPAWKTSKGGDQYRRSLYTFAKRTAPFAAFTVFDAPTGEACIAKRDRSNTPLQSLTLLNDPMYVALAESISDQLMRRDDLNVSEKVDWLVMQILTRPATEAERKAMLDFLASQGVSEQADEQTLRHGWLLLSRALMNTDEAITKN